MVWRNSNSSFQSQMIQDAWLVMLICPLKAVVQLEVTLNST